MVSTRGGKNTSPDDETPTSPITSKVTSPSSAKKLPVRSKDETEESVAPKPAAAAVAKNNIVVFGDDDDEVDAQITQAKAAAAQQKQQEEEQDEEESDDEAPEAVSTSKAADAAKESIKASQKAAQEYVHTTSHSHSHPLQILTHPRKVAAQKRKRQERDTFLKQQAEERKKTQAEAAPKPKPTGRVRHEKIQLPSVLPAEFLTDSSSEDEDDSASVTHQSKPKRRKVSSVEKGLARQERGPRDLTVGSTVYRVAKKVDERMAPKLKKQAKNRKDALLQRGRVPVKSRTSGSFFK